MMLIGDQNGNGDYIYENGTRFVGEFVDDVQRYESTEQSDRILNESTRRFVFDLEHLDQDQENVDIQAVTRVILRHWKPITNTFPKVNTVGKMWMMIELLQSRERHSIYNVNRQIVSYTVFPGKTCNITDPEHQFLFRQFPQILLELSRYESDISLSLSISV